MTYLGTRPLHHQPGNSPSALQNTATARPVAAGASLQPQSSESPAGGDFKQALADQQNFRTLAQKLKELAAQQGADVASHALLTALKTTTMNVAPGSSSVETGSTTLENYIVSNGLTVPDSHYSLIALADALADRALEHPLGNFSGALGWPVPLSANEQRRLRMCAMNQEHHLGDKPLVLNVKGGLLEFLRYRLPLPQEILDQPIKVLDALIGSPQGQMMGKTLQQTMNGVATRDSATDYLTAAMILQLDPDYLTETAPNKLAGFDLSSKTHWGKPLSAIVDGFSTHLSASKKTSPEMAKTAAHLLLSKRAPELLIKNVPDSVAYGSSAWVSLSIAAATIDAQTPGKVQNMTFAQVMAEADTAALTDSAATQHAQATALRVWGAVNGILSPAQVSRYSAADIEIVRSAFNRQSTEQIEASDLIQTEMPSRKDIALARLKERFGENVPFEEKLLKVNDTKQPFQQPLYDPNRAPAGLLSLLDIAMGGLDGYDWVTEDPRINNALQGKSLVFDVNAEFNDQLSTAISSRKKGIGVAIKHLIAQLPLADRQNFEYGKLEFFQNNTYRLGTGLAGKTLEEKNNSLFVKSTGVNGEVVYKLDLHQQSITQVESTVLTTERARNGSLVYPIESFKPTRNAGFDQDAKAGTPLPIPASFSSARTNAVAEAFVEHLEIDSRDAIKQAKGTTSFDKQMETELAVVNFFLDLIPLRSAIRNFQDGNYLDGATDLAMDIFSIVTAGAGAAVKAANVTTKAISLSSKLVKLTKIIGTTVIGELNPLSGVGDLLAGGARLANKTLTKAKTAATLTTSPYGTVTWSSIKVADTTQETSTVFHNGRHYAYDPVKRKPYGPPLQDFNPLDTLTPASPNSHSPRQNHGRHRYNPLNTDARPLRIRKPLPDGDYAKSMKGKLEPDHFKPDTKSATMTKFNEEMNARYDAIKKTGIPTRPVIPEVPKTVTVPELFEQAFQTSKGVVLGESHKQMASFKVLFDNAETLKNQGVKKVYFEGVIDMPQGLFDDGIGMLGQSKLPRTNPTFAQLCQKLKDNGIDVIPLDHYYLTRHKDVRGLLGPTQTNNGSVRRLEEFNYYAAETIQANSGNEKWVALVGQSHMNTSEKVPGLAELTESIGIGVFDSPKVTGQVGLQLKGRAPDPNQPIRPGDVPGDLQIYVQP